MGAGSSSTYNTLLNTISSSIQTTMKSRVDGSANTACTNIQSVNNVSGCTINFAEQSCDALAISNLTTQTNFDTSSLQDLTNQLSQLAESSNEGLILGLQVSKSSNFTQNILNVASNTLQQFETNCSKNVSGVNIQSVENTTCTERNTINFAAQNVTLEAVGDCVAAHVGKSASATKISNVIDQTAIAKNKGVDLWALIFLLLAGFGLLLVGPIAFRIIVRSFMPSTVQGMVLVFILVLLILLMALWWPGFGANRLGIWPWGYRGPEKDVDGNDVAICREGKLTDREAIVNQFMWWDNECITSGTGTCDDSKRVKSYKSCGLFSDINGCDDPEFVSARANFIEASKACFGVLALGPDMRYCQSADIANTVFDSDEYGELDGTRNANKPDLPSGISGLLKFPEPFKKKIGADIKKLLGNDGYANNCVRCEETEGPNASLYGMFANKELGCDASKISKKAYMKTSETGNCTASEGGFCYDNEAALKAVSPNDCMAPTYQARKKRFSLLLRACEKLNQVSAKQPDADGNVPLFIEQCPAGPYDYFTKCNFTTKSCDYKASDGSPPERIESCKNSLQNCQDEEFLKDKAVQDALEQKCQESWAQYKRLNPIAWIVTLAVYILMILVSLGMILRSYRRYGYSPFSSLRENPPPLPSGIPSDARNRMSFFRTPTGKKLGFLNIGGRPKMFAIILVILVAMLMVAIPPFGLIANGLRLPPFYDGDKLERGGFEDQNKSRALVMGIILAVVSTILIVLWSWYFARQRRVYKALSEAEQKRIWDYYQ